MLPSVDQLPVEASERDDDDIHHEDFEYHCPYQVPPHIPGNTTTTVWNTGTATPYQNFVDWYGNLHINGNNAGSIAIDSSSIGGDWTEVRYASVVPSSFTATAAYTALPIIQPQNWVTVTSTGI